MTAPCQRLRVRSRIRRFLLTLLLATLCLPVACAPGPKPDAGQAAVPGPAETWKRFIDGARGRDSAPAFTPTASLHYAGPEGSNRVVIRFWGNIGYPLRLDLQAGIGQLIALWREDQVGFTAYVPDKKTAFVHKDSKLGMAAFGIRLPFTLDELARLLNGRWDSLFPATYVSHRLLPERGYSYAFAGEGQTWTVQLDFSGRPIALDTPGPESWHLEFSGEVPEAAGIPERIRMTREPEEKAILQIKKLQQLPEKLPPDKLELDFPPDTRIHILENTSMQQPDSSPATRFPDGVRRHG